jgi:hypothetical protein
MTVMASARAIAPNLRLVRMMSPSFERWFADVPVELPGMGRPPGGGVS